MIGRRLGFLPAGGLAGAAKAAIAHRRVAHVVAGFIPAAVAAHDVLS
jgi:hypothetical protein